jgi:hypothetical protein
MNMNTLEIQWRLSSFLLKLGARLSRETETSVPLYMLRPHSAGGYAHCRVYLRFSTLFVVNRTAAHALTLRRKTTSQLRKKNVNIAPSPEFASGTGGLST